LKIGAENRNKAIAAAVLMGIALILFARMFFSGGGSAPPATPAAQPAAQNASPARPAPGQNRAVRGKRVATAPRGLDPSLRYDWLQASEDTKYSGTGRNIFRAEAAIPKPDASALKQAAAQAPPQPTGPPPPPPITLKFFGFASKPGEPKKVFLSQGEDVFIASEGDIVDRRYRVVHITPAAVEIEDVLYNHRQSIPLTLG
jgi:hypothetical protein